MGRYLKNTQLVGGSYSVQLPLGSNTVGPNSPVNGLIRFNQDTSRIEFYYNNQWNTVAKVGAVNIVADSFVGDGVTSSFTMSKTESDERNIVVTIGGVYQIPVVNYTISGTAINFTSVPPGPTNPDTNANKITVVHNLNSTDAAY